MSAYVLLSKHEKILATSPPWELFPFDPRLLAKELSSSSEEEYKTSGTLATNGKFFSFKVMLLRESPWFLKALAKSNDSIYRRASAKELKSDVAIPQYLVIVEEEVAVTAPEQSIPFFHASGFATLSLHERTIARLLANGLSNKEVALKLGKAPGTIRVHVNNIYKKLGVHNRRELANQLITVPNVSSGDGRDQIERAIFTS